MYQLRMTRKNKNCKDFFADHKASIFTPKFGKFLWTIWKIKSLASSWNLCPLNHLTQLTMTEGTKMNQRSSHRRCSVKKALLEIWQNSLQNTCARVSFLKNFVKKETLAQVFSCEFRKFLRTSFL